MFTRRLLADRSGNFGMLTALLMVPLIGSAGMAIDYGHAMSLRTQLYAAADAAAVGAISQKSNAVTQAMTMSGDGGVLFIGAHGMLMHETYGEKPVLIGEGLEEKAKKIPRSLPRIQGGIGGHEMNWIRAIRGEEKISCPFEYAARLDETMILGVVALRADQPIEYDGAAGRVTNIADANQYLGRVYRKGWEL